MHNILLQIKMTGQQTNKLYALTYEECKIVDPEFDEVLAQFGLTGADYERMTVEELAKLEAE